MLNGVSSISPRVRPGAAHMTTYLDWMNAIVTKYVAGLGAPKAELSESKVAEHYKEIVALAAHVFTDYRLPYMIHFGAHGLVNQLAARSPAFPRARREELHEE